MNTVITDPILAGLARGRRVHGGPHAAAPAQWTCDVAIVGSGAGAGITAELLARAGLDVVIVEEGPLRSRTDFRQLEAEAYPTLYQESASRQTADKAVTILQGRCVGGSTTVNWTSSFRTPPGTLSYWREHFGLADFTESAMAPWFAQAEARLAIQPWLTEPNENNALRKQASERLGRLLVQTRVQRLLVEGERVQGIEAVAIGADGQPDMARPATRWAEAAAMIDALPMQPLLTRVVSAHVMGGCGMAADPRRGVVRPDGTHWQWQNLSVHDGSLFPTSIGANPQLSVYGLAARLATGLVQRLGGRPVPLAA